MDQFSLYESFYGRETARFALFWSMQILSMVFFINPILTKFRRYFDWIFTSFKWFAVLSMNVTYAYVKLFLWFDCISILFP